MRRWTSITGTMSGHAFRYVGPVQHLRPGMLSYVTGDWAFRCPPIPGALVLARPGTEVPAVTVIEVEDPAETFWSTISSLVPAPGIYDEDSAHVVAAADAVVARSAVIGGRAFKVFRGKLCPSLGSVSIGSASTIGELTCIDRGIFGEFTEIQDRVHLDNLVHVGHSAIIGSDTTIAAHSTIGGWAEIGEGVRIETGVTVFQSVKVGDGARIGAGSVVTRDIPAGVLAYGNPARVHS